MRKFNRTQRIELFVAADGRCQRCGALLSPGWHGDHVQPYSRGGETEVINGQALCPDCNRKKGSSVTIQLRECQKQFVERRLVTARSGQKVFIGNLAPGGGKSLSMLCAADVMMREGLIDTLVVCVPRKNLGEQIELEWIRSRAALPWPATMGDIDFRDNNPPLIRGGASGYITTYSSLVSKSYLHKQAVKGRRVLLVLDEAQQLGYAQPFDDPTEALQATMSARICKELEPEVAYIIVMTGTATRADGKPLLFAEKHYSAPDENGFCRLNADVELTYRDGVAERFLRRFEAHLLDGEADWHDLENGSVRLRLSELEKRIYRVIGEEGYWHSLVDRVVESVKYEKQTVSPLMKGLITGWDIGQAKEIESYLKKRHQDMKIAIAHSKDIKEAQEALNSFRDLTRPDYADILVTVNMAYVGYDCKPISTIGILTASRTDGYLDQLSARAMRVMPELDPDIQSCNLIAPDDPAMRNWAERKRQESEAGMFLRDPRPVPPPPPPPPPQPELGYADNGQVVNIAARGYFDQGDIDTSEEFRRVERIQKKYQVAVPITILNAMLKEAGGHEQPAPSLRPPKGELGIKPKRQREESLRNKISEEAARCDAKYYKDPKGGKPKFGTTLTELAHVYEWEKLNEADEPGLQDRWKTVSRWFEYGMDGKK